MQCIIYYVSNVRFHITQIIRMAYFRVMLSHSTQEKLAYICSQTCGKILAFTWAEVVSRTRMGQVASRGHVIEAEVRTGHGRTGHDRRDPGLWTRRLRIGHTGLCLVCNITQSRHYLAVILSSLEASHNEWLHWLFDANPDCSS